MRSRHYSRRSGFVVAVSNLDNSQRFIQTQLVIYVDRIMAAKPKLNPEKVEILHWAIGPDLIEKHSRKLRTLLTPNNSDRLHFDEDDDEDFLDCDDFCNAVKRGLKRSGAAHAHAIGAFFRTLLAERVIQLQYSGTSELEDGLALFREIFGLSDLERDLCVFFSIMQLFEQAESFFRHYLACDRFPGRYNLAVALGATEAEIAAALNGKLAHLEILDMSHNCISLESDFQQLMYSASSEDLKTDFFKKIDPEAVPLDAHVVDLAATERLLTLLGNKSESPTHVLFYGDPGVGKTSYAMGLAQQLGLPVYVVEHSGNNRQWVRRSSFNVCVNMARHGGDAIILADDCDIILNTKSAWTNYGERSDKKWLHDVLETPGVRMIWIVNSIDRIEESVARRFSLSLGFKPFTCDQRITLWNSILDTHGLNSILDASQVRDLVNTYQSNAGVIEQAVRKAAETDCRSKEVLFEAVNMALEAHERLIHNGRATASVKPVDHEFTVEGLNVAGGDLTELMTELKAYDQHIKRSHTNDGSTMALLLHGPSGTGKSHFARHIGVLLDRPVVMKRASDLLSMWVGGTEQNIRKAYEEAGEDAVLIFDEADSLIFSRDQAQRSWEISQTNEFLTWIEQFRGIQVFTTNRLTDIDNASLRRFNHKLEFRYLTPEGVVIFYKKILTPFVEAPAPETIERRLKALARIAPGDFNVVRNKFRFKDAKSITHEALVSALEEEMLVKSIHSGEKAIGFMR